VSTPVPPQYERFDGIPLWVPCPWCGARRGERCVVPAMHGERNVTTPMRLSAAHPSRFEAAGADPIPKSALQP
jgi:hypothetical protein